MAQRELDVVVFGATGDTGVIGCCCLYFKGKTLGVSKWAPAGRNLAKLKSDVLDRFAGTPPGPEGVAPSEPIKADSGDYDSLVNLCKRTKLVIACAGPFNLFGEGLVKACAETGTHYVDVTGEVPWVEEMEQRYGAEATKNGATLVSMAGYDSVPPDLTAYLAAKALEKEGEKLDRYDAFVGAEGGAMPTGTMETLCNGVDAAKQMVYRALTFGLVGTKPLTEKAGKSEAKDKPKAETTYIPTKEAGALCGSAILWSLLPGFSPLAKQFCFGHFMAPINSNVVYRTAVQEGYGGFTYRERMGGLGDGLMSLFGLLPTCVGMLAGLFLMCYLPMPFSTNGIRGMRDKYNPPLTKTVRKKMFAGFKSTGHTSVRGYGLSASGKMTAKVTLDSKYDAGLGFTMLSACACAGQILKKAGSKEKPRAGFQTAVRSTGGESLAEGLKGLGVEFTVTTSKA